jgi:signal peptidase II
MVKQYGINRYVAWFFLLASFIALIDQISKFFVQKYLTDVEIIPGVLKFVKLYNTGAAFSLFKDSTSILSIISIVVIIILIILVIFRKTDYPLLFGLIVGGAFGNLIDRLFRGHVVDFIYVHLGFWPFNPWPIFNIADSAIVVGVFLIFLKEIFKKKPVKIKSGKKRG